MMKKAVLYILFFFCIIQTQFGQSLTEILILNEGYFNYTTQQIEKPVSIGRYNVQNKKYSVVNTIPLARFASDIKLHEQSYWVAADKYLIEYSLDGNMEKRSLEIEGIRRIDFYKDKYILVTRGEYGKKLDAYFQIYTIDNLALVFTIPYAELPFTCENILVEGNAAYVAVNNGFDFGKEVGMVIQIDMPSLTKTNTFDLGADGKNPENLMMKEGSLFTLNNKDYTGSSISKIEFPLGHATISTLPLTDINSLCGTSVLLESSIIYQEIGKTILGKYNIETHAAGPFLDIQKSFYGLKFENQNKWIIAGETDFVQFGKVLVFDTNWQKLFEFESGVSPGNFEFIYNTISNDQSVNEESFEIFPNPVHNYLTISPKFQNKSLIIISAIGQQYSVSYLSKGLDVTHLPSGFYFLCADTEKGMLRKSFIKIE